MGNKEAMIKTQYYKESNINCYTGSICKLLRFYNINVKEEDIWLWGRGYKFIANYDENGKPQLAIDIYKLVDRYLNQKGFVIKRVPFSKNITSQILEFLEDKPVIVWINSKYLKYSDIYYGQLGYLHAIELEKYNSMKSEVIVNDSLIVSIPPISCKCIMNINELLPGLTDIVSTDLYDDMGYIYYLVNTHVVKEESELSATECFRLSSDEIISNMDSKGSSILSYYNACMMYASTNSKDIYERMNINIKQLYALPSRYLLRLVVDKYLVDKNSHDIIYSLLDKIINQWKVIAFSCLKNSRTHKENDSDLLKNAFLKVDSLETDMWKYIKEFI